MKETKTELWRCQKRNILSVILLHIFLHDGKQALRSQQRNRHRKRETATMEETGFTMYWPDRDEMTVLDKPFKLVRCCVRTKHALMLKGKSAKDALSPPCPLLFIFPSACT